MSAYGELRTHAGEEKAMKNAMIRYILNVAPKKTPFKSIDVVKQCLRGEQKWFLQLLPKVQETLNDTYGLVIHEIKEKTGKIYLITSEFAGGSPCEFTTVQREELQIGYRGGTASNRIGNFKKNITETFVKQCYLKKEKTEMESGNVEERLQYSWGHRADLEFKKKDCLNFVAEVLKRPPNAFIAQFEECISDGEDVEMEEA